MYQWVVSSWDTHSNIALGHTDNELDGFILAPNKYCTWTTDKSYSLSAINKNEIAETVK